MIFESHAHYDDEQFDVDRQNILNNLPKNAIKYVINVGADLGSSKASVYLSKSYDYIYASVGVHPHDVGEMDDGILQEIGKLTDNKKVVAIGEIGLDYYYDNVDRKIQKKWFKEQIELAKEKKLPIIYHSRDAAKDTINLIKETKAKVVGGVIHCYSYSLEMAKEFVDMGLYIGIGGIITFKNSRKIKEVVENIPIEYLLIETDSPYLAPVPFRGKRNDSTYLNYIIKAIANIKNINDEKVKEITHDNASKLFGIN
ncbi:MAG: TatD family hydrolase [Eubacteriales bacterium]